MADPKKIIGGLGLAKRLMMSDAEKAAAKYAPGVHYADPLAPPTMRMSEALGNVGAEGKTLNFTEADRSRVFGQNRGGVGFSGLQHYSEPHKQAGTSWGFGNKLTAEKKIRQNKPDESLWTTFVGSPTQHKSNTVVIQDAINDFQQAARAGKVHPAQIKLINERLRNLRDDKTGALLFDKAFDLTDPEALSAATTFSRRSGIGDVLMGGGVKGEMRKKPFKAEHGNQVWNPAGDMEALLKRETDPDLVGAGTFDVGNRLFTMEGDVVYRPDLNIAFPWQTTGQDLGVKYGLVPREKAMRDWSEQYKLPRGKTQSVREPDYMDLSRNRPSQFVDEDYLTFLQKLGYKDGGEVNMEEADARLEAAIGKHMAQGGEVDLDAADARLNAAVAQHMAGGGKAEAVKGVAKGFKRLFGENVLPAAEREANLQKFLEPSKAPMRLYHATTATEGGKGEEAIRRLKPSKEGALGSGAYLTPKPSFANQYAEGVGGNVLPVHAQIKNPLIIEGKGDPMIEALMKLGMDESKAANMVERAYDQKGYIGKEVQTRAQAQGYDGLMQYRDGDLNEVVTYQPGAVKSAIGNEGTYDPMQLDLNKAHGGIAHMAPGGLLKGAGKLGKRLFGGADELTPATKGGTRKFGEGMGGLNIIKEPNGNWVGAAGSPESALSPLKRYASPTAEEKAFSAELRGIHERKPPSEQRERSIRAVDEDIAVQNRNEALNNWVDRNLTNYVKKQMGTADDPVRRLAEEGITHKPDFDQALSYKKLGEQRTKAGFPAEGVGQSPMAKAWEQASDEAISSDKASAYTRPLTESEIRKGFSSAVDANPWLTKLAPDTPVHAADRAIGTKFGFDHIMDVLREDLTTGRIRPEQLNKVSMEQAVRRTFEYDQELAAKMNAARAAQREGLPVYKEYPEGYRWVELNKPGAFASESEAMGHSARGYEPPKGHPDWVEGSGEQGSLTYGHGGWEGIKRGDAKVYSLVDSKGQPHTTIEVSKKKEHPRWNQIPDDIAEQLKAEGKRIGDQKADASGYSQWGDERDIEVRSAISRLKDDWAYGNPIVTQSISQIKGKSNRAPNEEYLPYVQDFVRSGKWSDVGDIQNAGLYSSKDVGNYMPEGLHMSRNARTLAIGRARAAGEMPDYMTRAEYEAMLQKHVPEDVWQYEKTKRAAEDDELLRQLQPPAEGMAEGGSVFKKLQFMDKGGITTSGGTFSAEDVDPSVSYIPNYIKQNAAEIGQETKAALGSDYERLASSQGAREQLAKITAAQLVGGVPDLAHLGLELVDFLKDTVFTKPRPRSVLEGPYNPKSMYAHEHERVPRFGSIADVFKRPVFNKDGSPAIDPETFKPVLGYPLGGSEDMIQRAQEAKLMGPGRFHPLTEIPAAIVGGLGAARAGKTISKGVKRFVDEPKSKKTQSHKRGGLTQLKAR